MARLRERVGVGEHLERFVWGFLRGILFHRQLNFLHQKLSLDALDTQNSKDRPRS